MAVYRHIQFLPPPPKSLPPKNEKPSTAENCRRTALPPKYYRHTLILPPPPKSLPPKNEKPPTAKNLPPDGITAQKVPPSMIPATKVPPCLSGHKGWLWASEQVSDSWGSNPRGDFVFSAFLYFPCSLFFWFFSSLGFLFGRTPC